MVGVESVLLTLSFASGGALPPGGRPRWRAGRAVPWPGFRPGSASFRQVACRPPRPGAGTRVISQRRAAARGD